MEDLREKVYECTLAVEAHMVCDLLARAGISARVDGEFLTGAGGDLPLGNTVKVRVDPARAAEAREVIADWEKEQSTGDSTPVPVTRTSRFKSPLWFLIGTMVGATVVFAMLHRTRTAQGEYDRNHDSRIDARWTFDRLGLGNHYAEDNDFDGRFEWQYEAKYGEILGGALDVDGDGRPDRVVYYENGQVAAVEFFFASGGRIVKRQFFHAGLLESAEFDDDGDGVFERRVSYDAHAEPKL